MSVKDNISVVNPQAKKFLKFLTRSLVEVGPSVGRLRKTHKKVPDHAVHTVKLGRLCLWTFQRH